MNSKNMREMVRLIGRADLVYHLEQAEAAELAARLRVADCRTAVEQAANAHAMAKWVSENQTVAALPVVAEIATVHTTQVVRLSQVKRGFAYVHCVGVMNGEVSSRVAVMPMATGMERVRPPRWWPFTWLAVAPERLAQAVRAPPPAM
jgi:hypothetical protein